MNATDTPIYDAANASHAAHYEAAAYNPISFDDSINFDDSTRYNDGDQVVLPPYGVGVIVGQTTRMVAGISFEYYEVNFPNGTSKAYVPIASPRAAGLRPALSHTQVDIVLERLNNGRLSLPKQWAARNRKVTEIISSGDPYEIAVLASELRRWDRERGLPDLDRQAYRRALRLLAGEISAVRAVSMEEARAMMDIHEDEYLN